MTTTADATERQFAVAGLFLEKLATAEFGQLAAVLEPDAKLSALLPRGYREWVGREEVCDAFTAFFGDMEEYELLDGVVGLVGNRLQLRWRLHVRGGRLGPEDFVVEQHGYADTGPTNRIQTLSLVCSGFCQEHPDG